MGIVRNISAVMLVLASLFVILYVFLSFFGQVFFGTFSLIVTFGSLSALAAVFGVAACAGWRWCGVAIAMLCLIAIACVGMEAFDYYQNHDIPGNYFGWGLRVPFLLCLAVIGTAHLFGHIHRPGKSLERTRDT
jgi:hypothetical protein